MRAATTEGLVGLDAEGQVIPALADRWIVTDDGRSFIFRLRDGTWPETRVPILAMHGELIAQGEQRAIVVEAHRRTRRPQRARQGGGQPPEPER